MVTTTAEESWLIYKLCGGATANVHVTDVSNASRPGTPRHRLERVDHGRRVDLANTKLQSAPTSKYMLMGPVLTDADRYMLMNIKTCKWDESVLASMMPRM